ncbi:phosphodiesterase [Chelativorans sp. YIM 93263]|uniref:phosphodiesterase n=1 Tax=Chelativorans sp. YIM 93263 TaxID=2906648 RepID=UPI0023782A89|nr:phosphodiesterase [Chelativorans sp. YIM 93263]
MTKILQISDTHIVPEGELAYEKVDTAAALADTVATINRLLPQIGPVDLVIVTGDLTEHGTPEEYRHFQDIVSNLDVPCRAVPGNHDRREAMRESFSNANWMPATGPIGWIAEFADCITVGLDSLVEGKAHGALDGDTRHFLQNALARSGGKPVLIGLHHPPYAAGIAAMDAQNLIDPTPLLSAITDYPGEIRLVCGHLHRSITGIFGGRICQVCPGTSHAVTLDHRAAAENSLTMEPGGMLLHEIREGAFLTHWIPVGRFQGPYPFAGFEP